MNRCFLFAIFSVLSVSAPAQDAGKLTATGGVTQLEGAGGGGLSPWALITGYGSRDSWGGNAHLTSVRTRDYALDSAGVAFGWHDKIEFSLAQQQLRGSLAPLDRLLIKQDIAALKFRLSGDAVYDQDLPWPQLAAGVMVKRNRGVGGLGALGVQRVTDLGAKDEHGIDYYLAATKLDLAHSLLLNGTLRLTKANQMGLLGFGGDRRDRYQAMLEVSAAYLFSRKLVAGIEYRQKPHNLSVDNEKDVADAFVAWFPSKQLSLTAAYATLGDITVFNPVRQRGVYLSLQAGF